MVDLGPRRVLIIGGGGFIGGHLAKYLLKLGEDVTMIDIKHRSQWWQWHDEAFKFDLIDASSSEELQFLDDEFDEVYNLAADMGGIGFIEGHKAACMLSVLITANVLRTAAQHGWKRVFYASSACVYPAELQGADVADLSDLALRESDAYPADPEDGYGWEKLFGERLHLHFTEDFGLQTRVARFHNVYGPNGTWKGGREKAPAALCRKIAESLNMMVPTIDVWGDGEQLRSFCYVDDAVEGAVRLMRSDFNEPMNIGSSQLVSINELIDVIERVAGTHVVRTYDTSQPQGVRGRNSDNTLIKKRLNWEPMTPLTVGIAQTYPWVLQQVKDAK